MLKLNCEKDLTLKGTIDVISVEPSSIKELLTWYKTFNCVITSKKLFSNLVFSVINLLISNSFGTLYTFKFLRLYRITHKEWDYKDDIKL